jgi:chloride channel protein, CIC family
MEQPNATDDRVALTPQFWIALLLTAVATGLFGDFLMWILANAEGVAFHSHGGSFEQAVEMTSATRRVVTLLVAGVFGATAWYLIRKYLRHERSEIDDAIWEGDGVLSLRRSFLTSIVSELVIGFGASLGREAAPKLMGGASGSALSNLLNLTPAQRKLIVACGGGAGLAAVYNVPLGGAIFASEVLFGSFALPVVLPALVCSSTATFVAWIYLPRGATYAHIPDYRFSESLMVWSLVAGVVIGALAIGYVRLLGWVSHHRASGPWLFLAMPAAFTVLGVIGIWYPQLFGNGKDMARDAFLGLGTASVFFALFALKPFVTALCLGGGASGGVFTPMLSTGAVFGAWFGILWVHLWPGTPTGAFAIVGAAAMIGAVMQAPLAGLVLVLELTHSGFALAVPMVTATAIATLLVRHVDGYSIYSARLPRRAATLPEVT